MVLEKTLESPLDSKEIQPVHSEGDQPWDFFGRDDGNFGHLMRRVDALELWCWRRLLRIPWTARRSNQSILKEISPGCSLEGVMLKLKLQYFGHLMRRVDSFFAEDFAKDSDAGWDWGQEEKGTTEDEMAGWHH